MINSFLMHNGVGCSSPLSKRSNFSSSLKLARGIRIAKPRSAPHERAGAAVGLRCTLRGGPGGGLCLARGCHMRHEFCLETPETHRPSEVYRAPNPCRKSTSGTAKRLGAERIAPGERCRAEAIVCCLHVSWPGTGNRAARCMARASCKQHFADFPWPCRYRLLSPGKA